jgi:hypothetical protein
MCNRDPLLRKRLDRLPNDDQQRYKQCATKPINLVPPTRS